MRTNYSRAREAPRDAAPSLPALSAVRFKLSAEHAGLRLDQALALLMPEHSRRRLQGWIDEGRVRVDGSRVARKHRLQGGEEIEVVPAEAPRATLDLPQAIPLAVVYEDDTLLVIDKPAGLVVHPGSGNRDGTLLNALLHHASALATLPRAGIVHRLDKDTSGLMVVAKSPAAQADLVRQLAAHGVQREYLALVRGAIRESVTIDAPIGRHPTARTTMAVVSRGRPARTHVSVVERFAKATLVRCKLETGRTHQIRVHLAAIAHPLVGDPVYGGRRGASGIPAFPRQALHAARLGLVHPSTGRAMHWTSDLPAEFRALLEALRAEPRKTR